MRKIQRLRGRAYLADGAVREQDMSRDGRHAQPVDKLSWHLVGLGTDGEPISCLRYRQHENTVKFARLAVSTSPLARSCEWGFQTRMAVEKDLQAARGMGVSYVELGGWAIARSARHTAEVLRMVLATYAAWRILGGALGIGTVTQRHQSGSIVKRLGGTPLSLDGAPLPKYLDSHYGCEMELLRFSSEGVSDRFAACVDEFERYLEQAAVIHDGPSMQKDRVVAGSSYWEDGLLCIQ